ncbi:MoaD/ThiS family protein [Mycolicibacterium komossense]|uniref:MoaD/ThiS family protein n=1 Tax=Mycolicibacterium komossense TaxID=1779 RepID=A0ABT3CDY9_9MYCO|nr:MoaD/ThiS family protein [Mycolicibacterium komossense]MCV7227607.1 MoaD/ThiS family protein [Mycolicibacterium komossense]
MQTGRRTEVVVTIRYFAAARAAAGIDGEVLTLAAPTSVAALIAEIGARDTELRRVLARCSYLCDEVAVRDPHLVLTAHHTLDVLPPFAGG